MSFFRNFLFVGLLLFINIGFLKAEKPLETINLEQYRWRNRLLFLFSPSPEVPAFRTLSAELDKNAAGLKERNLLVFRLLEGGAGSSGPQELTPAAVLDLRRRFAVKEGEFTVVLVGKDGTVKLKRSESTALGEIFGLIDSMPMRRQEMEGK